MFGAGHRAQLLCIGLRAEAHVSCSGASHAGGADACRWELGCGTPTAPPVPTSPSQSPVCGVGTGPMGLVGGSEARCWLCASLCHRPTSVFPMHRPSAMAGGLRMASFGRLWGSEMKTGSLGLGHAAWTSFCVVGLRKGNHVGCFWGKPCIPGPRGL